MVMKTTSEIGGNDMDKVVYGLFALFVSVSLICIMVIDNANNIVVSLLKILFIISVTAFFYFLFIING